MKNRAKYKTICILIVAMGAVAGVARAQLSPGDLSRPHEQLEGLRRCGNCHALGNREVTDKCLGCHREIAAMRAGGPGLHAADEYGDCVDCHVEHQGRDYELVHWPTGRDGFNHAATGYPLEGGHAGKDCRVCHRAQHVVEPAPLRAAGKDLDRTFLGLDQACVACHADPHAAQFQQDCTACHDVTVWKPAPRFDHATTAYPLTGRHATVVCASCHKPSAADRPVVFKGLAYGTCVDCHRDPHAGALGPRCAECHTTAGWREIQGTAFDHERTRYPLRGRHAQVTCAKCHESAGPKPAFATCSDCHRDEHGGARRGRPAWTTCEECHDLAGFRPARFTLADHDSTAYPLQGAHRAVACEPCHRPAAATAALDLAPRAAACTDCHADPHLWAGTAPTSCVVCHDQASWRTVAYDHAATRFPLRDRHGTAACASCHRGGEGPALRFGGEPLQCSGCHQDVHGGTMTPAVDTDRADCDRCHVTRDWLAENFDHDRDSRFTLKGGHAGVACKACHPAPAEGPLVVFRPLAVECVACHAVVPVPRRESP